MLEEEGLARGGRPHDGGDRDGGRQFLDEGCRLRVEDEFSEGVEGDEMKETSCWIGTHDVRIYNLKKERIVRYI